MRRTGGHVVCDGCVGATRAPYETQGWGEATRHRRVRAQHRQQHMCQCCSPLVARTDGTHHGTVGAKASDNTSLT